MAVVVDGARALNLEAVESVTALSVDRPPSSIQVITRTNREERFQGPAARQIWTLFTADADVSPLPLSLPSAAPPRLDAEAPSAGTPAAVVSPPP